MIVVSGAPNSSDYGSDRILHHTTGEIDRRQALEVFRHVVADAGNGKTTCYFRIDGSTEEST